jgi:hypothetical protein
LKLRYISIFPYKKLWAKSESIFDQIERNIGFEKVNEKSARKINFGTLIFVVGQSKLTISVKLHSN